MCNSKNAIETGSFAPWSWPLWTPGSIRVVDWNIERGLQLRAIIEFLAETKADLLLLQECDLNAKRTQRINIAREIARKLKMNYVFGCEFQELTQGSRTSPAYHGQATLSPWPLSNPRIIRFQRQSNFWRPRWFIPEVQLFQERIGGRIALVTEVKVAGQPLVSYNLHLESRGDDELRHSQLDECLVDSDSYKPSIPVILAGDLNFDVSKKPYSRIASSEFCNAFADQHARTTPPKSRLAQGKAIDWIFVRGPMRTSQPRVHTSTFASDHYPLSLVLAFA